MLTGGHYLEYFGIDKMELVNTPFLLLLLGYNYLLFNQV